MSNWIDKYHPQAKRDIEKLDGSQKIVVRKAIKKILSNPLPVSEGGYGKPLGNKAGNNLTGLFKVKLKKQGIRIVYELVRTEKIMYVVIVGVRADNEVYDLAGERSRYHE